MDRVKWVLVVAVVAVILLAGCQQPTRPEATPGATTPTGAPTEKGPIKVCALFDPRIPVFKINMEGIKVAAEMINEQGGVLGRPVEVIFEDTQKKVDVAVTAYRKAVIEDGCKIILMEGVSEEVYAVAEEGAKLYPKYPHILIAANAGMETNMKTINEYDKYKFYFKALHPDAGQGIQIAYEVIPPVAKLAGTKKIALWVEEAAWTECMRKGCTFDTEFGKFDVKSIRDMLEEQGYEVVHYADIAVGEKNFLPYLEAAKSSGAGLIMVVSSWYTDTVTLAKQWSTSGAKDIPIVLWGGPQQMSAYWKMTGGAALGLVAPYFSYPDLPPVSPLTKEFEKKWCEKGGEEGCPPIEQSTHHYISELFRVKEAMEKVGSTEDIDAVIEALEEMKFTNHTVISPQDSYFGRKDMYFHSYPWHPAYSLAQYQCGGKVVYISDKEIARKHGYSEEVIKELHPEVYKSPEELRKICK